MIHNHLKRVSGLCLLVFASVHLSAQSEILVHSHNDYSQMVPFYLAYGQMADSFEADVLWDEHTQKVLVAHEESQVKAENTLDELYILPIVEQFRKHGGKAWKNSDKSFFLVIDIKFDTENSIDAVLKSIEKYPDVFNPKINPFAPKIVFTGWIPEPEDFYHYPAIISFDGNLNLAYTEDELKRIAFFSDSFLNYSLWKGKGSIAHREKEKIIAAIDKAHNQGKKIRFWDAPDNVNTWEVFSMMGVDIINTDRPDRCCEFFRNEQHGNLALGGKNPKVAGI